MLKKMAIVLVGLFMIGAIYTIFLGNKLGHLLDKFDTQFYLANEAGFNESLRGIREIIEAGKKVISASRNEDVAKEAYSTISQRIIQFQNELNSQFEGVTSVYGYNLSDISHELTIGRCTLLALDENRFKELGETQKLNRALAGDFLCESAVKKEHLIKKTNRGKRRDQQGKAHFEMRCQQGDQGACEAVKHFDSSPSRPRARQDMEELQVNNCNNYGQAEKVADCLDYLCKKMKNETACTAL